VTGVQTCALPILLYSNGNLVDPSPSTDLSHTWYGGFSSAEAESLASSFALPSESLLESVTLFTYDTLDGTVGYLQQVSYAIFAGDSAPSGSPIGFGDGTILSSQILPGHQYFDAFGGLDTIVTSFKLASPLNLRGHTRYWLVVAAVTDPFGENDIAKWADSDLAGGFYLAEGHEISRGRAFELYGELIFPPPVISGMPASGLTLWPPNNRMVTVATVRATDAETGVASFDVSASSNEPSDPAQPEIVITGRGVGPRTIQVRAARLGTGHGRTYKITATAINGAGKRATAATTVFVPHDQGR